MKLKELAIDGFGSHRTLNLGRFGEGFSLVYGENGAGKSSVRKSVRATLFDDERSQPIQNQLSFGTTRLNVAVGIDEYQLSRDSNTASPLEIRALTSNGAPEIDSIHQINSTLNSELYDTVFNVSFRETPNNSIRLASVLQNQFEVPCGPESAGDDSAYLNWQRETTVRRERIEAIRLRFATLSQEKSNNLNQIDSAKSGHQEQVMLLECQISQIFARLNDAQLAPSQERLNDLDHEISQLQSLITNAQTQVTYVPPQAVTVTGHPSLYRRLDEIDNQIRRWRHVQSDIQTQRVRLRDEMHVWNELTLDSDEHPYHNARAILVALESKVDEAERNANHWGDTAASRVDTTQMARALGELCQSMRDDLYGLCNELGHQYKHIRHKAAAAELKQLRRCYSEMGENIQRLIQRRETVIHEIREIDPAGADAIIRADLKFCECAQHAGYLEARSRFVGAAAPVAAPPVAQVAAPILDAERTRLTLLGRQRSELVASIARIESDQTQLNSQHAELVRQRDALLSELTCHEFNLKIQTIDAELGTLTQELTLLETRARQDVEFTVSKPHGLIQQACELLSRISNGDLTQVFLSDFVVSPLGVEQLELQVRDRFGKVLNFSAIDAGLQDQVYLCLMLAAKEQLAATHIESPTLIDDAFSRIPANRVTPTLLLMQEFGNHGHQLIGMTQHRYLADRVPEIPVLELPPQAAESVAMPPLATVAPANPIPPAPPAPAFRTQTLPTETHTHEAYVNNSLPRPYPLSKYPRVSVEQRAEDCSYPVSDYEASSQFEVVGRQHGPDHLNPSHLNSNNNVAPVSVDSVGDRLGYAASISETMRLDQVGFFDANQLRTFHTHGLLQVVDLLKLDWQNNQTLGFHPDQVDRWQSQLWLLINIPGIRLNDARVLVACGVTEPEQLDTSHPQQIFERIERFFATSEGRRFAGEHQPISMERVTGWYRSLDATRGRWQNRFRPRSRRADHERADHERANNERSDQARSARTYQPVEREYRARRPREAREPEPRQTRERTQREARAEHEPRLARPPRMNTPRPERNVAPRMAPASLTSEKTKKSAAIKKKGAMAPNVNGAKKKLKFHLDLADHVEAGPSIGPKTAERFEKIGIVTVTEFLKQTAESMATKINYKRITADLIRNWQHQARLVCRIPNLRGHDSQLLVACGITEPEELSTMQPQNLYEIIGPFSDTKEGMKIIRNGKKPDLAEITDWISWAEQTRSLQAA